MHDHTSGENSIKLIFSNCCISAWGDRWWCMCNAELGCCGLLYNFPVMDRFRKSQHGTPAKDAIRSITSLYKNAFYACYITAGGVVVVKAYRQELKCSRLASGYFTLIGDKAPPTARDSSEVARA